MATWDLVITAGQSQMVGHGYAISPAPSVDGNFVKEWNDSAFVTLSDDQYAYSAPATYKAQTGSSIPAFGITFTAGTGRPIVVVRSAIDGTALLHANRGTADDWSTSGGLFAASVARANAAISAMAGLGHTLGRAFVIWSQGGKDAAGGNNLTGTGAGSYYAEQIALVDRYRTALSLPTLKMFIEKMYPINSLDETKCLQVQAAQIAAVNDQPTKLAFGFVDGESFKNTPKVNLDGVHYSQSGLNTMGIDYALNILDDYGITEPELPPIVPANQSPASPLGRRLMECKPLPTLPRLYNTVGTFSWTVPAGVTAVKFTGWGSGGGGRGGVSLGRGGMGGGSGERRVIASQAVTPGEVWTITLTAGGNGSTYNTNDGTAGGDTTLKNPANTTVILAKGGGKPSTASTVGVGGTGGTGGTGTNGVDGGASVNTSGSDGAAGGTAPGGGAGGAGGVSGNILGKPGAAPGGGGGGGLGNTAGANGGNGGVGGIYIELP